MYTSHKVYTNPSATKAVISINAGAQNFALPLLFRHDHASSRHDHAHLQYIMNKAIRDGKYLAPPHASAWQHSPH